MKINKAIIISFLTLSTIVFSGCAKRQITNCGSKGENIVCFGDSITFGYGVDQKESYPVLLSKMLDIPVVNAGIDGDTTSEGLQRINSDVLSRDPRLVIIEFGGNDFLRKVPLDVTVKNVRAMVEKIQAYGAMVALADISAGILMWEYKGPYKKIADEKGAIFIPSLMMGIITNPKMKSDFFHPNPAGYNLIAERVYKRIKPYLGISKVSKGQS